MNVETRRILTEEGWRSAAWVFIALVGWSFLITVTPLEATALTAVGLPALTVVTLTATMIGIRLVTGRELKARSGEQELLVLTIGVVAFGILALALVLTGEAGWWLFALYLVSIPVGIGLRTVLNRRYPGAFGVD